MSNPHSLKNEAEITKSFNKSILHSITQGKSVNVSQTKVVPQLWEVSSGYWEPAFTGPERKTMSDFF
jgi:hypothetical protein